MASYARMYSHAVMFHSYRLLFPRLIAVSIRCCHSSVAAHAVTVSGSGSWCPCFRTVRHDASRIPTEARESFRPAAAAGGRRLAQVSCYTFLLRCQSSQDGSSWPWLNGSWIEK